MNAQSFQATFRLQSKVLGELYNFLVHKDGWGYLHQQLLESSINEVTIEPPPHAMVIEKLSNIISHRGIGFLHHKDRLKIPPYRLCYYHGVADPKGVRKDSRGATVKNEEKEDDDDLPITQDRSIWITVAWNHNGITMTSLRTYGFPIGWVYRSTMVSPGMRLKTLHKDFDEKALAVTA